MKVGCNMFGSQLHTVIFTFLILQLHFHGYFSLNSEGFSLLAFRSKVVIDPFDSLRNWDPRDDDPCKWNGVQCVDGRVETLNLQGLKLGGPLTPEIGNLAHLKALVLSANNFTGAIPNEFGGLLMLEFLDLRSNNLSCSIPLEIINLPSLKCLLLCENKFEGGTRYSMEKTNCVNRKFGCRSKLKNKYLRRHVDKVLDNLRRWPKWAIIVVISITILFFAVIFALIVVYARNATAIDAWRIGLSGPLRNAFITGVPKLSPTELEVACEDFTNIINIYPNCTVYKGILSSGVEIAVVSTKATSQFDSQRSDYQFKNKIDTISRINHKNFVNLLGYCREDDPFMRMLVFEYAPNGTLFEHLHGFEHMDWSSRMRVIMGIAYCLQHMHDLRPAAVHPILQSSSIFITDDYAAKIADLGIFSEPLGKENCKKDNSLSVHPESNVYCFGILLLEIISGRMPISEDDGLPILDWAKEQMKDKKSIKSLVDPSLMSSDDNELQVICKVAEACIQEDPKCRPTMKDVTASLKEALGIEPEAAAPRLSPLWWAELEILSVEAS